MSWVVKDGALSWGQQLWREGEGSGLAGEAPAGTPTAAREFEPEHAFKGWLTVHPKWATIKTTPSDRLAIVGMIVRVVGEGICDLRHHRLFVGKLVHRPSPEGFPRV